MVDLRVAQPRLEIRPAAGVGREEIDRGVHADLAQRPLQRRVLRALQLRLDGVDVDLRRLHLSEQHEIVAFSLVRVAEHHAVGKRLEERADLALHRFGVALVQLHE